MLDNNQLLLWHQSCCMCLSKECKGNFLRFFTRLNISVTLVTQDHYLKYQSNKLPCNIMKIASFWRSTNPVQRAVIFICYAGLQKTFHFSFAIDETFLQFSWHFNPTSFRLIPTKRGFSRIRLGHFWTPQKVSPVGRGRKDAKQSAYMVVWQFNKSYIAKDMFSLLFLSVVFFS